MPKKFAFEEFLTQGRTGDDAQGFACPAAPAMDRPGQHGLAGAAGTAQQDHRLRRRHLPGQGQRPLHAGMLGNQGDAGMQPFQILLQGGDMLLHAANRRHPAGDQFNLFWGKGFGNVIRRPPPHGFHGGIDRGIGGNHHDLEPRTGSQQNGDQIQTILGSQPQIHKRQVEGLPLRLGLCIPGVADGGHPMPARFQADHECLADVSLVIDNQNIEIGRLFIAIHHHNLSCWEPIIRGG